MKLQQLAWLLSAGGRSLGIAVAAPGSACPKNTEGKCAEYDACGDDAKPKGARAREREGHHMHRPACSLPCSGESAILRGG